MFNPNTFIKETESLYYRDSKGQRKGQFFYNRFREMFPEITIPKTVDCFYDDKHLSSFIGFIFTVTN